MSKIEVLSEITPVRSEMKNFVGEINFTQEFSESSHQPLLLSTVARTLKILRYQVFFL